MIPRKDTIPSFSRPVITLTFIALNVGVFVYELTLGNTELMVFFYNYGFVPARYTIEAVKNSGVFLTSPVVPLFTSMFLHGGWTHLIGNVWSLWLFGDNVEDKMGKFNFIAFYILSGIAATAIHFLFNPRSTVPTIGASGAISGIMGAYFAFFPYSRIITLVPLFFIPFLIEIPAVIYLGIWFLSQFFSGTFQLIAGGGYGGVAWWAHVGGFIFGMLAGRFFVRKEYRYF